VANTAEIAAKIANFEADIGLIEGELHHPDILLTPWQEDERVVFCAPDHDLAGRPALEAYVERGTARPAFRTALDAQLAPFPAHAPRQTAGA